jgi:hypothetical protein
MSKVFARQTFFGIFQHKRFFILAVVVVFVLLAMVNRRENDTHPKVVREIPVQKELLEMLEFYRHYSYYTDPGEHVAMYHDLPSSLPELCGLIKAQLIHPSELPRYRDVLAPEKASEDGNYQTVKNILAGLAAANPAGLTKDREPGQRLILSCRYHAILLASILKSRNIPVRVRYGFARYLHPGHHIYHVICEVWNDDEQRWMLVDPDRKMVDFSADQFEFAPDAWIQYRQGKLDTSTYGVQGYWGAHPILSTMSHDLASVLGNEHIYWDEPPVSNITEMEVGSIPRDQAVTLDEMATLLRDPDMHFSELQAMYDNHKFLQFP